MGFVVLNENFEYKGTPFKVGEGYICAEDPNKLDHPQGFLFYPEITLINVSESPFMRIAIVDVDPETAEYYEDNMWVSRWVKVLGEVNMNTAAPLLIKVESQKNKLKKFMSEVNESIINDTLKRM